MVAIRHKHLSGQFKAAPGLLDRDLDRWGPVSDVITLTEVAAAARAEVLARPGWSVFQVRDRGPAARECAVMWRSDLFELVAGYAVPVTDLTTTEGRLRWPVHTVTVVLRHLASGAVVVFDVCHLPAHVEGSWAEAPRRVRIYRSCVAGRVAHLRWLVEKYDPDAVWVGGDWNLNMRRLLLRRWVVDQFAGLGLAAAFPEAGTHRTRIIDGGLTDASLEGTPVAIEAVSSDHRAVATVLSVAAVKEPPRMLTITGRVAWRARRAGVSVLARPAWASDPDGRRWPLAPDVPNVYDWRRENKPARQPADTVVQHITVTLDHGQLTGDFRADVRTVERIGFERFGSGISYNFVVDMTTGQVAVGQPLDAKGTHTVNDKNVPGYSRDQNLVARAIAVLGMPGDRLSPAAEEAIVRLLVALVAEGAVTEGFDYDPHSKFAYKDCPCDPTRDRMSAIRARVAELLAARK